MATDPAIGVAIRRARERKRWTQRQLADAIRVNIKSVDNWENGRTHPRSSIGALESVLGVDLTGGGPNLTNSSRATSGKPTSWPTPTCPPPTSASSSPTTVPCASAYRPARQARRESALYRPSGTAG